jgi:AmmeMemoRadiSam system protein B
LLDWKTPLGTVKNDAELGKKLEELGISQNEEAHAAEHSIEVQLPFLQFACPSPSIVPVIASTDVSYIEIAAAVKKAASVLKRKITIIASSDFTHYGPAYGYVPFSDNIKENMFSLDRGAIEKIKSLDASKFIEYVNQKMATICGQVPIAVLLEAVNAKKANLLKYYTSGDIVGDYTNAVGYASIIMR